MLSSEEIKVAFLRLLGSLSDRAVTKKRLSNPSLFLALPLSAEDTIAGILTITVYQQVTEPRERGPLAEMN